MSPNITQQDGVKKIPPKAKVGFIEAISSGSEDEESSDKQATPVKAAEPFARRLLPQNTVFLRKKINKKIEE